MKLALVMSSLLISMQAFQKGSPLAADVSEAILTISEKRILKALEEKWFPCSAECSATENDELSLGNFWALYLLCGATSTLYIVLFFLRLLIDFNRKQPSRSDESVWMKTVQLVHFFHNGQTEIPNERLPNLSSRSTGDEWISARWSTVSPSDARSLLRPLHLLRLWTQGWALLMCRSLLRLLPLLQPYTLNRD